MATKEVAAVNIGKVVRDGLQLKSQEAVALVYEACTRLETGVVGRLPASIDELSVTNAGVVKLPSGGEPQLIHTAAAGLLESLLGAVNEETEPVPSVLRSLPARLGSAATDTSPAVRDLLSVLRWHLRLDPRQVLQELVARAASAEGKAASAEGKHESAAVAYEIPLRDAAGEIARQDLDLSAAGLPAVESIPAGATPAARPRLTSRLAVAAAAVVALSLSAYGGYRYTSRPGPARPPTTAAIAPPPIIGPRVTPDFVRGEPQPLQLPVTGGAFSPSFTAEPRTLLFHAGHNTAGRLYTATLDDRGFPSDVTPLFDERARNYHARLSPDGRWVAFDSDRDGERGVYIADRSGTSMSRVNGEGFGAVPSWSPDMKSLAFIRSEPGRPRVWNLWIRTLVTGELSRATNYQYGQVWGASWFPDSASYAYSHEEELIIADRSGRRLTTYRSPVPGRIVRTPAVSPDGRQIVFQVFREGVWVLDLVTGNMRALIDDPSAEEFAWDPSGRRIAYHSRRDGEWRIWVLPL